MSELLHADIFFFITAVVVIIIGVGSAVVLYYLVLILRDIRAITKKVRSASDVIEQDFTDLHATLKSEGLRMKHVLDTLLAFVTGGIYRKSRKKKVHTASAEKDEDTHTKSEL